VTFVILLFMYGAGVEPSPLSLRPFIGLLYQSGITDDYDCGAVSGMNERQDKPKYWDKTCPSAALPTADPTRLDPESNMGRHGGKSEN
jgi:hypothetical protein